MKYKIVLFFILLPVFALAQTKISRDSLAKLMLDDLVNSWTLGIDSTSEVVDIKVFNKFKSLFDVNATVDDDFNAFYQYDPKKKSDLYNIKIGDKPKNFDVYAHDVALQIKSLIIDSIEILSTDISDPKNINFTIKRRAEVEKIRQYVLPDNFANEIISGRKIEFEEKKDSLKMASGLNSKISANQEAIYRFTSINTIRVTMAFDMDTVRIIGIKSISNEVICTNDADQDAVLNQEDSLKNKFGDFTANGMPDYDLDGIWDDIDKCKVTYGEAINKGCPSSYFFTKSKFDVFVGLQYNSSTIALPERNQLGYVDASGNDAMDVLQSRTGALKSPSLLPGAYLGGNYTHYFGQKRKQVGISIGFTYSRNIAEYELTDTIVYTFKSFDGFNSYRRRITINSLREVINYSRFNIPVMLNYRFHLDKKDKSVINIKVGPSLMIFNNTSNYNASIDFGGIYQIDTIRQNAITYYDRFDRGSKYNIFFTSGNINAQNQNPGANNVFGQLSSKSYDFADNKNYNGKQDLRQITVAFNVEFDLQYKFSEGMTIKAGPHFVYAPQLEQKGKYVPINKTTDEFQSVYKGNTNSSYSALGINVGFVYNF